ncbi:MAG: flagellar assembly protein FliW [Acidobacteriota bacterium]
MSHYALNVQALDPQRDNGPVVLSGVRFDAFEEAAHGGAIVEDAPSKNKDDAGSKMRVETRFGTFDTDRRSLVEFPAGVPAFEQCRHFVVMAAPTIAPFQCLHAVDGPAASFLVISPRLVLPDYRCKLNPADRQRFQVTEDAPLLWLVLVSLKESGEATANLRAPIVINPARMIGYQVIPHDSVYPIRYPMVKE